VRLARCPFGWKVTKKTDKTASTLKPSNPGLPPAVPCARRRCVTAARLANALGMRGERESESESERMTIQPRSSLPRAQFITPHIHSLTSSLSHSKPHATVLSSSRRPIRLGRAATQRRFTTATSAGAVASPAADADASGATSTMVLHNTMSRKKEVFTPREGNGNKVTMYVCGVTVYDYSHIGGEENPNPIRWAVPA
jgi:hypothetical protein